jgi:integrase
MKTTEKLNFNATKKYANDLLKFAHTKTDTRLKAGNCNLGLLVLVGLETGLRISDLLLLKYSDISKNDIDIDINIQLKKTKKNHTSPISHSLYDTIENHRLNNRTTFGYSNKYLFYNYSNKSLYSRVWASNRISVANKNGLMGEVLDVAGCHSLRRSSAINVFERTNDIRLASAHLGHKNIVTTSAYLQETEKSNLSKLRNLL